MKLVFLSDTHNKLSRLEVPDGDLLLHAGDFCGHGTAEEVARFNEDMMRLPHRYKVVIAGNHDWPFEREPDASRALLDKSITYLQDEMVELDGLKIYGSPWQPEFFNWAFNLPRKSEALRKRWNDIPSGIDILITHGPPHGILDQVPDGAHVGCELLRERVEELQPRVHLFGHIHHSYGLERTSSTTYVNAANVDERYQPVNAPITLTI